MVTAGSFHLFCSSATRSPIRAELPTQARVQFSGTTSEHDGPLHSLGRMPSLKAALGAIFGDASDHLESPIDGRHKVYVEDLFELVHWIDARLASDLVDAHRKIVAGDAGGRHAHSDGIELETDGIKNRSAKSLICRVALVGVGDLPAGLCIDFSGDAINVPAHIHERHRSHIAAR